MALISAPEPVAAAVPTFRMTPKFALKWTAALTLFTGGMHYVSTGRRDADIGRMVTGAVLIFASLLILI